MNIPELPYQLMDILSDAVAVMDKNRGHQGLRYKQENVLCQD